MLYATVGLLFLLADQFLKFWTVANIELNAYPGKEILGGLFHLTYIKNTGIAFGFLGKWAALRWILLVLLLAFAAFVIMGILKGYLRTDFARWTGSLLLAGLMGNGVDRAIYGYVVDMIEPTFGSLRLPVFNIADCLVTVFGILFCIALIKGGIGAPLSEGDEDEEEEEEDVRPRRRSRRLEEEEEPPRRRRQEESEAHYRRSREEAEAPRRHRQEGETPRRSGAQPPVRRRSDSPQAPARRSDTPQTARPAAHADARQHREDFENALNGRPVARSAHEAQTAQAAEVPATTARRPVPTQTARPTEQTRPAASVAPVRPTASRPTAAAKPIEQTQPEASVAPVRPAAPRPASAPAQPAVPQAEAMPVRETPKPAADEFDLDSILAEFK